MFMKEKNGNINNNVNHPIHYNKGSIEAIDAMLAAFGIEEVISFCKINAFKYIWRANNKGKTIEDLQKASWYINKTLELYGKEHK